MALINCPECEKQISDQALSCPHCGTPIHQKGVQTIEKTAKNLKAQILIAVVMLLLGLIIMFGGTAAPESDSSGIIAIGILLFLAGLIWIVTVKILVWWRHE